MFSKTLNAVLLLALLGAVSQGFAQGKSSQHLERLRKLRDEINKMQKQIAASEKKESSVLYVLSNLDLEIDLAQSLIQNLKKERKEKERQIRQLEKNLKTSDEEIQKLKDIISKRMIYTYKYGRSKDLELLFTAKSLNEGILWLEYQKRLSAHDYRNYLALREKQNQISRDRDLLAIELQEKQKLLRAKQDEERKLKEKKKQRQKILSKVRRDTNLLRQQLAEKEKAAAEIRKIILRLESEPRKAPLPKPETLFADLRGRMLWPVQGKIVSRFGKVKHPELKTVTENIGIEIKAPLGNPVQAVAGGKVTAITWQRGSGNIVIISHYGGFYTVYTHLQEIFVDELDDIQMGQIIGSVGESGSTKGPILHFEIWKGSEKLNPEDWLAKN